MYLRFILPGRDPDSGVEAGIFQAAYALAREGQITAAERHDLTELLVWFETEFATPQRFNRATSKGHSRRRTKSISWVKDTAVEHVTRLQRITQILRDHGHHVAMIRSANPGYVVYEDDHQIVAEPFRDVLQRV